MADSQKSDPILVTYLPKPSKPDVEFVYNFYVKNETNYSTGRAAHRILNDANRNDSLVPRSIKVTCNLVSNIDAYPHQGSIPSRALRAWNRRDNNVFNNEVSIQGNGNFGSLNFQDLNVDDKLKRLVSSAANRKIALANKGVEEKIDELKTSTTRQIAQSNADLIRVLRRQVVVSDDFLQRSIEDLNNLNESFIDEDEKKIEIDKALEAAKKATFNAKINLKFIGSCAQSAINDPLGSYSEEMLSSIEELDKLQKTKSSTYQSFSGELEDITVRFFENLPGPDSSGSEEKLNQILYTRLGFFIKKSEVKEDGSIIQHDDILVSTSMPGYTYQDNNVAYGKTYSYGIHALYVGETHVLNSDLDRVVTEPGVGQPDDEDVIPGIEVKRFLMTSEQSASTVLTCTEKIPPRPPVDLNLMWDVDKDAPLITWRMPFNKQRDIKRFQVLRRKSINEPFEVLVEYDFDDSETRFDTIEKLEPSLRIKTVRPQFHYFDKRFKKEETWIYTMRSIDAHGLISNYAEQFKIKYNSFTNKLDFEMISGKGARSYMPNEKLSARLFEATLKDSNHRRMKIYFDPEYLRIYKDIENGRKKDISLYNIENESDISSIPASKFKFQILNADMQQSEIIDIVISDKTTSKQALSRRR